MKILFNISLLFSVITVIPSYAKTYTGTQLRAMIKKNNYPDQGPSQTQTQEISYSKCKEVVLQTVRQMGGAIPSETIADTSIVYSKKLWNNDSAMLFTCSAPDNKLTIVISPYI